LHEGTGKYSLKVIYPKIVWDDIFFITASTGAVDKGIRTIFMTTRNKCTVLILTLALITTFSFVPRQVVYAETTPSARIIGYAGSPGTNYEYVEWNKLTEVVIGTTAVTSSTNPTIMDASGTHFTTLTNIRNEARAVNPNIKVLAQLTGGNWQSWDDGHLTAIMGNATYRSQLATNLASFISTYNLDGIDIDWEGTDITEANYHAFLVSLRTDLPSGKIISVDAPAAIDDQPATDYKYWFNPATDSPYINWFDIMSYGFTTEDFETYANMWFAAGFSATQLNFGYATEGSQEDDISLVPAKVAWTLDQGAGGEMVWMVDSDVNGVAEDFINTIYNVIYPPIVTTNVALNISTSTLPNATVGNSYSQSLTATGGTAPYTWTTTSGTLPAGLSLSSNGVISGTPTTLSGSTSVTFEVTDSTGATAVATLPITVVYSVYDVNMDGTVNVLDLILVGQDFGEIGTPGWIREDVNGDGVINVLDMILVAQHISE
jgi:hypothetical protein